MNHILQGRQDIAVPIGYLKDPDVKNHLIPDPETAGIVQRIFELTAQGMGKQRICRLFEDREKGVISEKTYCMMMKNYENEQTSLETDIVKSEEVLAKTKQTEANVGSWLAIIGKYTDITELNAEILNEFIEKILIHKPEKDENGNRTQKIDICYRFIGIID